jgi:hypothetical protein
MIMRHLFSAILLMTTLLIWVGDVMAQAACTGFQGTWTWPASYPGTLTLTVQQSVTPNPAGIYTITGNLAGPICGGNQNWNVNGTVHQTTGALNFTATGAGCAGNEITFTGSVTGFTCNAASGTWVNNAQPFSDQGNWSAAKQNACEAPTIELNNTPVIAAPAGYFFPNWYYPNAPSVP